MYDLGIKAIWLSPIFESPMVDFGYDVSDFYNIANIFGNLEDFKSLKKKLDSFSELNIVNFLISTILYKKKFFVTKRRY